MAWAWQWAITTTMGFPIFLLAAWGKADYFGTPATEHLSRPRKPAGCWGIPVLARRRCGLITIATGCWICLFAIMCGGLRNTMCFAAWTACTNRIARRKRIAVIPAGCFTIAETERSRM